MARKYQITYDGDVALERCDSDIAINFSHFDKELSKYLKSKLSPNSEYEQLNEFSVYQLTGKSRANDKILDELRLLPGIHVGSHIFREEGSKAPLVPNGRIYVRAKEGYSPKVLMRLLHKHRLLIEDHISSTELNLVTTKQSINPVKLARKLTQYKTIEVAQPDFIIPTNLSSSAQVPLGIGAKQWYLHHEGTANGNPIGLNLNSHANIWGAWREAGSCGTDRVTLAMVDRCFDNRHPEFEPGSWVAPYNAAIDQVGSGANASNVVRPDLSKEGVELKRADQILEYWHGTLCAGIAIGKGRGPATREVYGAAPNARFLPISKSPNITNTELERILDHILVNQVDVLSCSWEAQAKNVYTDPVRQKINHLARRGGKNGRGCIMLFSAGNLNEPLNGFAGRDFLFAVGATNSLGLRQPSSNKGRLWVCAPAGELNGFRGDTSNAENGLLMYTTDFSGQFPEPGGLRHSGLNAGPYSFNFGETSGATPLVAGICAFLLSLWTNIRSIDVMKAVEAGAKPVPPHGEHYNTMVGHGKIDALAAYRHLEKKFGKPNL